jgi:hypothetical protein
MAMAGGSGPMTPDEVRDFYRAAVGEVPPSVEQGLRTIPGAITSYLELRRHLDALTDGPGLPGRYASLVFALLDVAERNYDGALNHGRAALRQGLSWDEFLHGMVQTWIVKGFATSWGTVGWRVVDALAREGFGPTGGAGAADGATADTPTADTLAADTAGGDPGAEGVLGGGAGADGAAPPR